MEGLDGIYILGVKENMVWGDKGKVIGSQSIACLKCDLINSLSQYYHVSSYPHSDSRATTVGSTRQVMSALPLGLGGISSLHAYLHVKVGISIESLAISKSQKSINVDLDSRVLYQSELILSGR